MDEINIKNHQSLKKENKRTSTSNLKLIVIVGVLLVITIVMSNYFFSIISKNSIINAKFPTTDSASITQTQATNSQLLKIKNDKLAPNSDADSPDSDSAIVNTVMSFDDFRQESQNVLYRESDSSVVRETDKTKTVKRAPVISQEAFRTEAQNILYRETE